MTLLNIQYPVCATEEDTNRRKPLVLLTDVMQVWRLSGCGLAGERNIRSELYEGI